MAGKTVLVTGSTDGVGRYVAARPATARVLIHGRDGMRPSQVHPQACDEAARKQLRALSLELTGLSAA